MLESDSESHGVPRPITSAMAVLSASRDESRFTRTTTPRQEQASVELNHLPTLVRDLPDGSSGFMATTLVSLSRVGSAVTSERPVDEIPMAGRRSVAEEMSNDSAYLDEKAFESNGTQKYTVKVGSGIQSHCTFSRPPTTQNFSADSEKQREVSGVDHIQLKYLEHDEDAAELY